MTMDETPIGRLADFYVETSAQLDPCAATSRGILGHDDELTDWSPTGIEARVDLARRTLAELGAVEVGAAGARVARDFMAERLRRSVELSEAGEELRSLNILFSPLQRTRSCFDLMPRATADDWRTILARMAQVPDALVGYRLTLEEGRRVGLVAAHRQVLACAHQCDVWGGRTDMTPYFVDLAAKAAGVDESIAGRLADAAQRATQSYADFGDYLRDTYAADAARHDGVGADRYSLLAPTWLGVDIDLAETYDWGWEELGRVRTQMREVAGRVKEGASLEEVVDLLENDPERAIEGEENLRRWLQDLMDRAIADLDGSAFDIPEPVKRVEAMIAPPGGAAAMYYTPPSEDFSRPGRTWYPTQGRTRFPLWGEVSTAYHEGVPGHHLQLAMVKYLRDDLTRYQRMGGCSGHSEGWALYAERLMGELGYLDNPDHELGMLLAQAFRAARVVVDIGLHLGRAIPADQPGGEPPFHPGERWTPELAMAFMERNCVYPPSFVASEVDRYLGMPGQAISYKVGERVWLRARAEAEARHGDGFDLKAFHAYALALGPLGLDLLEQELARF